MFIAGRDVSVYEVLHGKRARWWWDRRYITEAEQEAIQSPPPPAIIDEIDQALALRCKTWQNANKRTKQSSAYSTRNKSYV